MNIGLIVEVVVAALLLVTIGYCYVVERRLASLRSGQDGLREVIAALNSATQQAQASVLQLKAAGETCSADLKKAIADARTLADELSVMVEAGDGVAERLAGARPGGSALADPATEAPSEDLRAAVERLSEAAKKARGTDEDASADIAASLGGVR